MTPLSCHRRRTRDSVQKGCHPPSAPLVSCQRWPCSEELLPSQSKYLLQGTHFPKPYTLRRAPVRVATATAIASPKNPVEGTAPCSSTMRCAMDIQSVERTIFGPAYGEEPSKSRPGLVTTWKVRLVSRPFSCASLRPTDQPTTMSPRLRPQSFSYPRVIAPLMRITISCRSMSEP